MIRHSEVENQKTLEDDDSGEEELVEQYFNEYFHPTENVSSFLQDFKADLEAPKDRTTSRIANDKERVMSMNF